MAYSVLPLLIVATAAATAVVVYAHPPANHNAVHGKTGNVTNSTAATLRKQVPADDADAGFPGGGKCSCTEESAYVYNTIIYLLRKTVNMAFVIYSVMQMFT